MELYYFLPAAANKAREDFDEADRRVRDLTRELRSLEETQEKDYGPEEEFRVMDGNCYEFTDREYTYRLCPFDKVCDLELCRLICFN